MKIYPNRKPIPPAVRSAVMQRAAGRCEDCGRRRALELHHLTYRLPDMTYHDLKLGGRGDLIFGYEGPQELAALCRDCHEQRHIFQGVFYADIDELNDLFED